MEFSNDLSVPENTVLGGTKVKIIDKILSSTVFWIFMIAGLFAGVYYYFYETIFNIKETIKKSIRDKLYSLLSNNQLSKDGVVLTVSKDSVYQSLLTYLDTYFLAPSEYQDLSFLDEDDESETSESSYYEDDEVL